MNVLIIGATGLLGQAATEQLIKTGHTVTGMPSPCVPDEFSPPRNIEYIRQDCTALNINELSALFEKHDTLVLVPPGYDKIKTSSPDNEIFYKHNVASLQKILTVAKESKITNTVICGSYFTYFDRTFPEWELQKHHPYIKSMADQAKIALDYADADFSVSVLEFPNIFGDMAGDTVLCRFLMQMTKKYRFATLCPKGGTALITSAQAGQCIARALSIGKGGQIYPVATSNMTWKKILSVFREKMNINHGKLLVVPDCFVKSYMKKTAKKRKADGYAVGFDMVRFASMITHETYISDFNAKTIFRIIPEDMDKAIYSSIDACIKNNQSSYDHKA